MCPKARQYQFREMSALRKRVESVSLREMTILAIVLCNVLLNVYTLLCKGCSSKLTFVEKTFLRFFTVAGMGLNTSAYVQSHVAQFIIHRARQYGSTECKFIHSICCRRRLRPDNSPISEQILGQAVNTLKRHRISCRIYYPTRNTGRWRKKDA